MAMGPSNAHARASAPGDGPDGGAEDPSDASLVDALLVYAEPLADGAHAVVVGDAESGVAERLFDLGARSVHVFDPDPARAANAALVAVPGVTVRPLVDELDVRGGAYDLALVPDIAELNDPRAMIERLRHAVGPSGSVVAMGRARVGVAESDVPFASELGIATLEYGALYELFAAQFDDVTLAGVLPFTGVVFAELGGDESESPPVTVDTRLASSNAPSVFVVIASQGTDRRPPLDSYAIVQVAEPPPPTNESDAVLVADLTAMQLKTELLVAQVEEARERFTIAEMRGGEVVARLERAAVERDLALTRGMELEALLAASQQSLIALERRLLEAERILAAEGRPSTDPAIERTPALGTSTVDVTSVVERAEQAETALAIAVLEVAALRDRADAAEADLARIAEVTAVETSTFEERLRERARVIAALEKELLRREGIVRELVAAVEERDRAGQAPVIASAPPTIAGYATETEAEEEREQLRRKLDALAADVARREGEIVARGWKITELENEAARLTQRLAEAGGGEASEAGLAAELAKARDEVDALRQALTQEHGARVAAESGEELARVRSQLAQQMALVKQMAEQMAEQTAAGRRAPA
jgi:hypothetical protein